MKKLLLILITSLGILLLSSNRLSAQQNVESNVIYGMHGGLALLMDVYYPNNPNGTAIIVIPGSGWHQPMSYDASPLNQKGWYLDVILGGKVLLENGYTLFVINHRSAPVYRYPEQMKDVLRSVQFVRHNAERFGINPEKIGAMGHSSGGHLASMLGTMDETSDANSTSSVAQKSSRVQAVVALAPATDLVKFVTEPSGDVGAVSSFVGTHLAVWRGEESVPDELALFRNASPINYISENDAPFLIVHGNKDTTVPFSQSEVFYSKLKEQGISSEFVVIEGGNHSLTVGEKGVNTEAYYTKIIDLFDRNLRE